MTSPRIHYRRIQIEDFELFRDIWQDPEVTYAFEFTMDDKEMRAWIERQQKRYEEYGDHGAWAMFLKDTGEFIGHCGVTRQDAGGEMVLEVGYLLRKKHWHKGYATEAARACMDYVFGVMGRDAVFSLIRDTNLPSIRVAERNGMTVCGDFTKGGHHILVYTAKRPQELPKTEKM